MIREPSHWRLLLSAMAVGIAETLERLEQKMQAMMQHNLAINLLSYLKNEHGCISLIGMMLMFLRQDLDHIQEVNISINDLNQN